MNSYRKSLSIPVVFCEDDAYATACAARAMSAARSAQTRWAQRPVKQRLGFLRELRRLIVENARELAAASAIERSRPVVESLTAEVLPLAEACRFLERNAEKILGLRRLGRKQRPLWLAGVRSEILREPFGVVLIIGPGNYPLFLPGVQVLQALAAGNAVVLKPGVGGSAPARALLNLIVRAGFPAELVYLLPEAPEAARAAILAGPDKVLFTGSAATGQRILAQLAPQLIPATMELSGCDAVIVRADADLNLVTRALAFGLRLNDGATCISPKRVFVARSVATELEGRLSHRLNGDANRGWQVRTPTAPVQALGTLSAAERLHPLLEEALAAGAHFIAGDIRGDGSIDLPVVLAGVSPRARLLREDVFAPVLAIVTVADDHEALLRANDCPFALAATVFTRDEIVGRALASSINAGVVTINDLILPTADPRLPFGGHKHSGFGVTRGAEGLLELTRPKVLTISRSRFRPAFDAPGAGDEALFEGYLNLTQGHGFKSRCRSLLSLLRTLFARAKSSQFRKS
ncbi:MAG TPA: aldehyde dehydrogenase family protein [Verrucomicrobiae bacterium]